MQALQIAADTREPNRDYKSADECCSHVFLRVPDIALRAEIGRAEIRPYDLGDDGFDDFEKAAQSGEHNDAEPCGPAFGRMRGANQQFTHRIKQQKAEAEVNHAIVVIAIQVQPVSDPKADGNVRVGVMRSDGVKDEKDQNERIRCVREPETPISEAEHGDTYEDKKILKQPIAAVHRMHREDDPKCDVACKHDRQKVPVELT